MLTIDHRAQNRQRMINLNHTCSESTIKNKLPHKINETACEIVSYI